MKPPSYQALYRYDPSDGVIGNAIGQVRPAVILSYYPDKSATLHVFTDGFHDFVDSRLSFRVPVRNYGFGMGQWLYQDDALNQPDLYGITDGEVLYGAYQLRLLSVGTNGRALPEWEHLPAEDQDAWRLSALALKHGIKINLWKSYSKE